MYELMSFVNRGKSRKRVLKELNRPMTPTDLSNKIQIHRSTISRTLIELEQKGLVKCLTPKEKMGRYYEISEMGKKILSSIEENNR